jgi:hypothetical protein
MEISSAVDKACALMITPLTNVSVSIHIYISLEEHTITDATTE